MADETEWLTHRLLTIDDNPAIHEDYRKILACRHDTKVSAAEAWLFGDPQPTQPPPAFDVSSAMQGQEGVELARRALAEGHPYSVAFVDMRMPPGWDGLETIENLWKIDPEIQVVVCSAYSDYDWMELLARLGRPDKLLVIKKPFEHIEILQSASALSRKWQDARALKRHVEGLKRVVTHRTRGLEAANRQLRHLASHDSLTGLPNLLLLEERITQTIAQAKAHEFAVAVLDLDRFKLINDSLGHRAGDEVLCEVAARLKGAIRAVDSIARSGGDEFVIVFDGAMTRADLLDMGERILKAMEPSMVLLGIDVHVSYSLGIALYPHDGATVEALLARADAAVNHAKKLGRNNVQFYTESMGAVTHERVKLASEPHEALRSGNSSFITSPRSTPRRA